MRAALRWYLPLALVAVTFNLRPALMGLGLIMPAVQRALTLSPFASGAVTALPIFALGATAAIAVPVGRRLGWSGGLVLAMASIAGGTLLRSAGTNVALFAGTALLGIGMGLGNVYVPTMIKARFEHRIGLAMTAYTAVLTIGALFAVGITPLLFAHFQDWRPTLGIWAFPALAGTLVGVPLLADNVRAGRRVAGLGLWRSRLAWSVAGFMGVQSALFYGCGLWFPALIEQRGVPLPGVAADLTAFYATQFIGAIALPVVLAKIRRQDLLALAFVGIAGAIIVAILYGPPAAIVALCALLGIVLGATFAMALTFQVLRSRSADYAARLAAMSQTVGYCLGALGPLVLGLVNRIPQARLASAICFIALVLTGMFCGRNAGQPRFVDDA